MEPMRYASMPAISVSDRTWPDATITTSPEWCAVDLRDGNQALPNPMTPAQKKQYFKLLCDIGFKQIEVGFPAASADDFGFCRMLIEEQLIPDDVVISVLTQARSHLIGRTMEALVGAKQAVVHFYVATSDLHRAFVFGLERNQLIDMAAKATRQIREAAAATETDIGLEFSPEEFSDTDLDFAIAICDCVAENWGATPERKVIMNLPMTVERRLPNHYADMIELFARRRRFADSTTISVHCHNDMGMGVAATTQGLLAGAGRVEGTLFGHGERTGNVDLVTVALNLQYLGIDTGLDFSNLMEICDIVAEITDIPPHPRQPYVGELVFTAFSGSHQDAIRKGLSRKDELTSHFGGWKVPYLHVSPAALGRSFERFIRINSQSGKGGIAHVMEAEYHVRLPRWVQIDFTRHVQAYADATSKELASEEVWNIFTETYVETSGPLRLINYWPRPADEDPRIIRAEVHIDLAGERKILRDEGNGPISAFVHAIRQLPEVPAFVLDDYEEETRGHSAEAEAICFMRLAPEDGSAAVIGIGFGNNIDQAAVRAVCAGLNTLISRTPA